MFVLGPLVTKRIQKNFATVLYKQDTEETELVKTCLQKLVNLNYLNKLVPDINVKVVHSEGTVGLWMGLDQTLFVSIAALKVADMDEAKLALLVSHELAHYLMDH